MKKYDPGNKDIERGFVDVTNSFWVILILSPQNVSAIFRT
jgi:hypothetical protein